MEIASDVIDNRRDYNVKKNTCVPPKKESLVRIPGPEINVISWEAVLVRKKNHPEQFLEAHACQFALKRKKRKGRRKY